MKPFSGLKVVELASVLAGPLCGSFFAELGARVIKIEHPLTGDITRSWKLPNEDPHSTISAYFAAANYGKEYVSLDLKIAGDLARAKELITGADILLSNFKKGDDVKFGLTSEVLQELNPGLIHGRISGFGPNDDRTAFDMVLQAEAGFLSMCGTGPYQLAKMPVALIDVLAAHQLKEGILVALLQKARDGKGSDVSVSLFDTAISSLVNQASNWLMAGHIAVPYGTLHPNIAPYGEIIKCADGRQIVLAAGNDKQFEALCQALNIIDMASEDRFKGNVQRVQNRKELGEILNKASSLLPSEQLMQDLLEKKVPCGWIRNLKEVFEDPKAQALLLQENIAGTATIRPKSVVFSIHR